MKSELRRLERQIEALLQFKRFQQAQSAERDAREWASYQASMLAAIGAPTRPNELDRYPPQPRPRPIDLNRYPPQPRPRPIDDLLLDRRRQPPAGRPVNLRAVPVLPTPRVRPPTRHRLPPTPMVG